MVLPWQGTINKRQVSTNIPFFISRSPQKYSLFILLQKNGNCKKNLKIIPTYPPLLVCFVSPCH
jgi:hypothetical protein